MKTVLKIFIFISLIFYNINTNMLSKNYSHTLNTTINFAKRDLKTRYTESLIGSLWIIIYPLAFSLITAGILSFAFKGSFGKVPYALFILVGFNSWFWFSQTIIKSTKSLIYNRDLIINNKFPTESIVFSIVMTSSIDFLVNTILILILFSYSHTPANWYTVLLLIFIAILQLFFQTGVSLLLSAINVYFRDTQNIIDIVLQLLFYLTPVVYTLDMVPHGFTKFVKANPLTLLIDSYREAVINSRILPEIYFFAVISIISFYLGYLIYKKLEKKFPELL